MDLTPKLLRRLRGRTTQQDWAVKHGVAVTTVSRWENGHCQPQGLARRMLQDLADERWPDAQ